MKSRTDTQCFDCKERHIGCHSSCKSYQQFKARLNEVKRRRLKDNEIGRYIEQNKKKLYQF